jgi:glycosyltransferase involved in cell wall biosynthesis
MTSFLDALHPFLKQFPDHQELDTIKNIRDRSEVLYLGMDLQIFDDHKTSHEGNPLIVWNHRWEYDKNPELFFKVLSHIKNDGLDYELVVLGENFSQSPTVFEQSKESLRDNIVHWGYVESFEEYAEWLWKADILPVTSNQEFFGASFMEAIYCDTWPILPNRLTYPELIPREYHSDNLYDNEDDLYEKTSQAIKNSKNLRKDTLSNIAQQFDWKIMAPEYDTVFSALD